MKKYSLVKLNLSSKLIIKSSQDSMESASLELLPDPCGDRQMKTIAPPPHRALTIEKLYSGGKLHLHRFDSFIGKPDWKVLHANLKREGRVDKACFVKLINDSMALFSKCIFDSQFINFIEKEKNLLYIKDPITIVGDIHGQFYDLLKLIEIGGSPDSTK